MVSAPIFAALVGLLYAERLFELWLSQRNARWARAQGAIETGRADYAAMVLVHALFPAACLFEAWHRPAAPVWLAAPALVLALGAQGLRYWAIATLGRRWNTRIVVLPDAPPVVGGPYRFLRHPNYVAVALELAAFPLIAGAWLCAIAFSAANAVLLARRIPAEERALGPGYQRAFARRPRFIPEVNRAR
jgi:methyltransferase